MIHQKFFSISTIITLSSLIFLNTNCSKSTPASNATSSTKKTIKVPFIGNSLTYTHDIPNTLKELAQSSNDYQFEVDSLTEGGMQINYFLIGGASSLAYQKITSSHWDFVVLQQQSISQFQYINPDYFVQNSDRDFYLQLTDPENSSPWCQNKRETVLCTYERLIRAQGAEPVFYMHWTPSLNIPLGIVSGGSFIFGAQKLNAIIAPVGPSFFRLKDQYPSSCGAIECILQDDVHPGPLGAYAAATMFYATLTHSSPLGLTALQGLSTQTAQNVQQVTWETYLSMKNTLFSFSDTITNITGTGEITNTYGPTSIPRCLSVAQLEQIDLDFKNESSSPPIPAIPTLHTTVSGFSTSSSEGQCYHFVE